MYINTSFYGETTLVRNTNYKKTWSASIDEVEELLTNTPDYAEFSSARSGKLVKFMTNEELTKSLDQREIRKTDLGQIFFVMPLFPEL